MNLAQIEVAKKIVKNHGVKGFRKLKLKRPMWVIGKQTIKINKYTALRMIERLEEEGFTITQRDVTMQMVENEMIDTITITV